MFSRYLFTFLPFILSGQKVPAQIETFDVRDFGMASSAVAAIPMNSISKNTAVIPTLNNTLVSIQCISNFNLPETTPFSFKYQHKLGENTSIKAGLCKMGFGNFYQQYFETGIAKKLGTKFSAGIQINYTTQILRESHNEKYNILIPEAGILVNPLKDFYFGVTIRNPVRSRVNTIAGIYLPAQINPGISYNVSEKLTWAISALQRSKQHISFQSGIEYKFFPILLLRCGIQSNPFTQSFGAFLKLSGVNLDIGFRTNPYLGNSSGIALTFSL